MVQDKIKQFMSLRKLGIFLESQQYDIMIMKQVKSLLF